MLGPHRSSALLDVALSRARREHGALLEVGYRISLMPGASGPSRRMALDAHELRPASRAIFDKHGEVTGSKVISICCSTRTIPSSVRSCLEHGAQQCPRRAHRADPRRVGGAEHHMERTRADQAGADRRPSPAGLSRMDQAARDAVSRRTARHDAAQRQLLLQPARHIHRARRQHRAHPRCEIFHPAADSERCRRRDSTCSNGRRSCARFRRTAPIAGSSTTAATGRGASPSS